MPEKIIGPENWALGVASNKYGTDGGFSPAQKGNSLEIVQGALSPSQAPIKLKDLTAGMVGVCFANDGSSLALYSTPSAVQTVSIRSGSTYVSDNCTGTGKFYSRNISDFIRGTSNYFLSSATDIARVEAGQSAMISTWWSATKSQGALTENAPHHFSQLNDEIYFNEDNVLHRINSDETVDADVFTLAANKRIYTHCAHKGLIYMSVRNTNGFAPSLVAWDGNESGLVDVDMMAPEIIYSIVSFNGSLYCIGRNGFYEYNGLGFVKIKKLRGVFYKSGICQVNNVLYMTTASDVATADADKNLLAFDGSAFYYPYGGTKRIECIGTYQTLEIHFVSDEDVSYISPLVSTGTGGKMSTLPIDFIYNSYVDEIIVELADVMVSTNSNTFKIYDEKGVERKELVMSFAVHGASKSVRFTGLAIKNLNSITIQSTAYTNPIRRFTVVYRDNRNQPY